MIATRRHLPFIYIILLSSNAVLCRLDVGSSNPFVSEEGTPGKDDGNSFVSSSLNVDNDLEVRISHHGIHAMHKVIYDQGDRWIIYQTASDGKHTTVTVYINSNHLIECDESEEFTDLEKFYSNFFDGAGTTFDISVEETFELLKQEYSNLVDFDYVDSECRRLYRLLEDQAYNHPHLTNDMPNTSHYLKSPKQSQRKMHRKRMVYPGTNWCGNGNTATSYHDLGEHTETDKCCRAHDHCPYAIAGRATKYNLYNIRLNTLSHCACDIAFKKCLKRANSNVADEVGTIFFDVFGMKCFTLEPQSTCVKWTWYGECTKYERQYHGVIKDSERYQIESND